MTEPMDSDDQQNVEESERFDILDSSIFGPNAKMFECILCNQKFTNKLKITTHWSTNHQYKLCSLCVNYAFKYDSDKIAHENLHLPFGCSSCDHEFTTVDYERICEHYKSSHESHLCEYCSSVIDPFSKYPEHCEKKHNVVSFPDFLSEKDEGLYELIGEPDSGFFNCRMCKKKKRTNLIFGHFAFYHNLSLQALKKIFDKEMWVRVNGSMINENENEDLGESSEENVCRVCKKNMNDDSNIHGVFCQGFIVCHQKDCEELFQDKKALQKHIDSHPMSSCKFGCKESLKAQDLDDHLQKSHDIVECSLCNIINSSGSFKNHLRDKHSVNLMTYEKALKSKTTSKLYRVEMLRQRQQVLCNLCDHDITQAIREFTFINHFQEQHQITAIIKNLDKNPISETNRATEAEDDCLKNFTVVMEKSTEELIEDDFDTSRVYCVGSDSHDEKKPQVVDSECVPISCEFCEQSFDAPCYLYEHLTDSHGFKLLNVNKCNTCHVKLSQPETSDEDNKSFNLTLVCPLDESSHVTKENFASHMEFQHLDHSLRVDKVIYKCFECNFTYNKLESIRKHFKSAHPDIKMSYCRICRIKLSPCDSGSHFSESHADVVQQIKKFLCKLCKKSFKKKTTAKVHYENCHKKKETARRTAYKCLNRECKEAFENKDDRKMHQMIAHPDEKMFVCKSCPLKFSTKSSLSSHNLIHRNVVNTCEHCQKTFIRRDSYKEHLLIHSGVRQKCSFCDKTFVQRSNLVRHERIHLNDKPYKCSYCEKTFSDKGACNSHEKVHTKSESSNCEVCGKHFARKQKLKYHMRIHTLENVLKCECGKIFPESYSFRKHQETHTKGGRYKCEYCGKKFRSIKAKTEHSNISHGPTYPETNSLIDTKIQCTLCNSKDFTIETIKDHLSAVHNIDPSTNWEAFINEVEYELDISDPTMS